jgi:oxygen-independent coproporphyrinogen-3 oxidase
MCDAIYIHVPFCINKCEYCDFLSFKSTSDQRHEYVKYLKKEIELYPKYEYDTVYFGGGTPSLLDPSEIKEILNILEIKEGAEVTLEVNPKSVDFVKLKEFKNAGINRLSIGVQSFDPHYLKLIGRLHTDIEAVEIYEDARRAGFENISLDLMFSLPGQCIEDVRKDLVKITKLRPEHISIYSLIWEEGTPLYRKLLKEEVKETENEVEADMYELIIGFLKKEGYIHYEVSNFALPEKEARHNSKYWENKEYVGVGLGASGYIGNQRYKNAVKFEDYYGKIRNNEMPVESKEEISFREKNEYKYILGLRLLEKGVIPEGEYINKCLELEKKGYLMKKSGRYILTSEGLMVANDVFENFID